MDLWYFCILADHRTAAKVLRVPALLCTVHPAAAFNLSPGPASLPSYVHAPL